MHRLLLIYHFTRVKQRIASGKRPSIHTFFFLVTEANKQEKDKEEKKKKTKTKISGTKFLKHHSSTKEAGRQGGMVSR